MDKSIKKKVTLGIFFFLGVGIFFVGIFYIGKKGNLFSPTFTISAIFNDISGLKKENYVYYAGLRAGSVKSITFINDSLIKVDMQIDKELQHLIKLDSKIFISTEGLVGDKVIEIKPVFRSKIAVNDGDTLIANNPFNTHEIIEKLLSTNDNASIISDNLAKLSYRIAKPHKGLISTLTEDTTVVNEFLEIVHSLGTTSKQMAALSTHLDNIASKIDSNKGVIGALLNDEGLKKDLTYTLKRLTEISDNSLKLIDNLNASMQAPSNKNAIAVLTKDSVFAKNLSEGIENFKNSTYKLDQNMDALSHSVFFRKYFKKNKKSSK